MESNLSFPGQFLPLEIFGEVLGDIFELPLVLRIDVYEGLMRLQASAGDVRRFDPLHTGQRLKFFAQRFGTFGNFKQMGNAQIIEVFRQARIGINQLDQMGVAVAITVELKAQLRYHAKKGAVHRQAIGQIQDKALITMLPKFGHEFFQIEAGREIGAVRDLDAGDLVENCDL